MTNDSLNGCFRMTSNNISNNVHDTHVHDTSWFHDYDIRIIKDSPYSPYTPYGIYISSEFSNPNDTDGKYKGMLYHEEEGLISIELGTHDESLIAEAVSLCKDITEKFVELDRLLRNL